MLGTVNSLTSPLHFWRLLRGSDRFAECVRVALALGGIVLWCLPGNRFAEAIPALLGAIACALAETEDHWRSRLGTLLLTLACFAVTAYAVQWLMPWPWLFALALPLATFALVMLGAISGRYATIAGATLILSVYSMIGADLPPHATRDTLSQPLLLLLGAAWYGALSLAWSALAPQMAIRQSLARLFDALADYLDAKAALFVPAPGLDRPALQLALARQNERVVDALNDTRLVLIDRIGTRRPRGATAARLQQYFMAQDIHERVSSSHYPYDALAAAFFHSDVLFRCARLLGLQAGHCRRRADALRLQLAMPPDAEAATALDNVAASIAALHQQTPPPAEPLMHSLEALHRNVTAIQRQLSGDVSSAASQVTVDQALQDPGPRSPGEAWARIRIQFTPRSLRFRHALRLALALLLGDALLQVMHSPNGYWILLTTLLICQPSYGATRRRLLQRVAGTIAGLIAGWAALHLFVFGPAQLLLLVISGVVFFAARHRGYALATAAITLFVVLCFNQLGNGYEVMWPRLLDTLIGAAIAALVTWFILPDWHRRRLNDVLADTLRTDAAYLQRIIGQYASGRQDDLDYRIARRDAHNANAALSGVLGSMLREPDRHQQGSELLLRFLTRAHTLLGHLSTLGAHRQRIADPAALTQVAQAGAATVTALQQVADALLTNGAATPRQDDGLPALASAAGTGHELSALVQAQLTLVLEQRDRLAELGVEICAGA
jgi:YccS/YhfK family integral membrane protein